MRAPAPLPTPGAAEAARDNPDCAELVRALALASDAAPAGLDVAGAVRAALLRRARVRMLVCRIAIPAAAAAAAVAVVSAGALPGPRDADRAIPPQDGGGVAATADAARPTTPSVATLLARQRPDGSWRPERGGVALAPAATGLAVLRLLEGGDAADPEIAAALGRAAAWFRANQNADGSFGSFSAADSTRPSDVWNLALSAAAVLRLYENGNHPELFNPADGAVSAVRRSLRRGAAAARAAGSGGASARDPSRWLAATLARAGALEWPDSSRERQTAASGMRRPAPSLEELLATDGLPAGA